MHARKANSTHQSWKLTALSFRVSSYMHYVMNNATVLTGCPRRKGVQNGAACHHPRDIEAEPRFQGHASHRGRKWRKETKYCVELSDFDSGLHVYRSTLPWCHPCLSPLGTVQALVRHLRHCWTSATGSTRRTASTANHIYKWSVNICASTILCVY